MTNYEGTTMTRGTFQRDGIYVYAPCDKCQGDDVLVYERGDELLCAEHTRRFIAANPAPSICDRCGNQSSVVRDPSHRRNEYLCLRCHSDDGFLIEDTVTGRAIKSLFQPFMAVGRTRCAAAGYGSDCDDNVKPRNSWGGKSLCNKHGRTPPKKETTT